MVCVNVCGLCVVGVHVGVWFVRACMCVRLCVCESAQRVQLSHSLSFLLSHEGWTCLSSDCLYDEEHTNTQTYTQSMTNMLRSAHHIGSTDGERRDRLGMCDFSFKEVCRVGREGWVGGWRLRRLVGRGGLGGGVEAEGVWEEGEGWGGGGRLRGVGRKGRAGWEGGGWGGWVGR